MKFLLLLVIIVNSILDLNCKPQTRIRGGDYVDIKDVPYQVSIKMSTPRMDYHCGGSILDKRYVLTAAHCLDFLKNKKNLTVTLRFGTNFRDQGGVEKKGEAYIIHPQYDGDVYDYDFSVIKVDSDIEFGPTMAPVRLPTKEEDFEDGHEFYIAGWGETGEPVQEPRRLKGLTVFKLNIEDCFDHFYVTDQMLCVTPDVNGVIVGTGKGDSGGGLVAVKTNTITSLKTIHGVASFGRVGKPSGFAKVSVVFDWINGVLNGTIPLTPF